MTLIKTTRSVQIRGEGSESFEIGTGLKQGDPLSTLLFNLALEKIIRE
jgi:hypothetical protein